MEIHLLEICDVNRRRKINSTEYACSSRLASMYSDNTASIFFFHRNDIHSFALLDTLK